jgi:hypothetical protein
MFSISYVFIQKQTVCLTSTCVLFFSIKIVPCLLFCILILSKNILDLASNIKNMLLLLISGNVM